MIPGVSGATLKEWAQRSERRGFSSLVVDDRLVWGGYDVLITATIAAATTDSIGILTAVVLAPLRTNAAAFAKQVASIDRLSEGRLMLGLGVGSREEDFLASSVDMGSRGMLMNNLLERTRAIWQGRAEPIGPKPTSDGGPPLYFGGNAPAVFRRVAKYGSGWICATSGGIDGMRAGAAEVQRSWDAEAKPGSPRILALAPRFALGPNGQQAVDGYLRAYNAYRGEGANQRAATALVTPALVREQVARFEEAGCDELVISPCDANPDQVDLLADAIDVR